MAKFRSHHNRKDNPFVGLWLRVIILLALSLALFFWVYHHFSRTDAGDGTLVEQYDRAYLIPKGGDYEVVHHTYYSLGYSEDHEQAAWACYVLNREELRVPNVERTDWYEEDELVTTGSTVHSDYSQSGYTRGHLVPAGDMAFDTRAMAESFFMSNMSPQKRGFNGGIWRDLEEHVRDWAYKNGRLYVVTGPLLDDIETSIGRRNRIAVPARYYKAVVDIESAPVKGIAFILPNTTSTRPLMDYAVSIDVVEKMSGLDLFGGLFDDPLTETKVEAAVDPALWPISQKRYRDRVENWNND